MAKFSVSIEDLAEGGVRVEVEGSDTPEICANDILRALLQLVSINTPQGRESKQRQDEQRQRERPRAAG